MFAHFGKTNKRSNSTLVPSTDSFPPELEMEIILKDSCSVIAPVISVIWNSNVYRASEMNYCFIPYFGRYYFITDAIYERNRVTFTLSCDVLASYYNNILDSTQYVLRSASDGDMDIVDDLYPATSEIVTGSGVLKGWSYFTLNDGYYVIGVINDDTASVGCVSYYVFTNSQFAALRDALLANYDYMQIDGAEVSRELQRAIINPFQYIVSCKWFPEKPPVTTTVPTMSICGWKFPGITASRLAPYPVGLYKQSIVAPQHPQANRGHWLRLSPYSQYSIFFPPFGVFPIDPTLINWNKAQLNIDYTVDFTSGIGAILVTSEGGEGMGKNALLYYGTCMVGVDIQLSQLSVLSGVSSAVSNVAVGAVKAATGDAAGGAVGALFGGGAKLLGAAAAGVAGSLQSGVTSAKDVFAGVGSSLLASMGQLQVVNTNGSISAYQVTPAIFWKFTKIVNRDNEDLGTPCCSRKVLKTLSGFTTVQKPDISIFGATLQELNLIREYMSSGFFIERGKREDVDNADKPTI